MQLLNSAHKTCAVSIAQSVLLWAICVMPFLVRINASTTPKLQDWWLAGCGALAWLIVVARRHRPFRLTIVSGLLAAFIFLTIANLFTGHIYTTLWGAPYLNIGIISLISGVGVGLALMTVRPDRLLRYLYITFVLVAVASLVYSMHYGLSLVRLSGIVQQADVLAILLAIGLLIGIGLWSHQVRYRPVLLITQLMLLSCLILTETRAVFVILALLFLLIIWSGRTKIRLKLLLSAGCGVLVVCTSLAYGTRSFTSADTGLSTGYRLSLQSAGVKAVKDKPLLGYGIGNVEDGLTCRTLRSPALQTSCREGYYFNSSHNIFLDRFLGLGTIGGLAYLAFVVTALYKGYKLRGDPDTFFWCGLAIALYYLTNVTSLYVELLFMVCLCRLAFGRSMDDDAAD